MKTKILLVVSMVAVGLLFLHNFAFAAEEIKIGVIQAQTGMYAGFGTGAVFGIKAAADDINKLGGVDVGGEKMKVELVIVDNKSDPNNAGTMAQSLVTRDRVKFLLSGDEPPPMHPGVSMVAERYKIPYVTSVGPFEPWTAMRNETDTKWRYTWATGLFAIAVPASGDDFRAGKPGYTVNDYWVDMLLKFKDKLGSKKVAVIASDEPDGVGWYSGLGQMLKPHGFKPIGLDKKLGLLPLETTDFSSVINKWKVSGTEVLWGNCPAPFFGALWKQCQSLGFKPKVVFIGRAPLFYQDIISWGGDLPQGIGVEIWWDPTLTEYKGIGDTTPMSLVERWKQKTKQPMNPAIGPGYRAFQVLVDAISRAGTLDSQKVNAALAETDLMTIGHRVKFDENHFSRGPLFFGQWQKVDTPEKWKLEVIYSHHEFVSKTAEPLYPIPYK
ncbi:MAG: ABC transporter substrate-binding protein [Desulfobacteraceae bacterium]|jgi:ABC-type branched-subunit amino acid transport system substrate-binding protein